MRPFELTLSQLLITQHLRAFEVYQPFTSNHMCKPRRLGERPSIRRSLDDIPDAVLLQIIRLLNFQERCLAPHHTLRRHSLVLPPRFSPAGLLGCAVFGFPNEALSRLCGCRRCTMPQLGKRWTRLLQDAPADLWEDIDVDIDKELRGWPLNAGAVAAWFSARPVNPKATDVTTQGSATTGTCL